MNKIILGDNQAIFRAGIAKVLASEQEFRLVAQCSDMARTILAVESHRSSIVVFASALKPDLPDFTNRVKAADSRAVVIAENGELASSYTAHGIRGVVYRNTTGAALVDCVYKVVHGLRSVQRPADAPNQVDEDSLGARVRDSLTSKEMKVAALIVQGCKNKEIAQRLGNSEQVIKNHLRSVYEKVGVSDRLELALFIIHQPLLAEAAEEAGTNIKQAVSGNAIVNALQLRSA
jgi:DNA-binding NarL/FixJ family response regulator